MVHRVIGSEDESESGLSLVRDDLPFRLLRRLGLVPRAGLGVVRRAVFFALVAWLPIAVWAVSDGRALPNASGEALLQHFGVQVRCLLAIPLLILAQGLAHSLTMRLIPWFVRSGIVEAADRERLRDVVQSVARLRDATLPWTILAAILITWIAVGNELRNPDDLAWAAAGPPTDPHLGFGGWWFVYVSCTIYLALLLAWLWRVVLLATLFWRMARLPLSLVPTHPDRTGGLGFVERLATMFSPVVFALSAVFAAHIAHQVLYHDMALSSLRTSAAVFIIIIMLVVFLAPFLAFISPLAAAKRDAELKYGALVGEHGRLVRKRWILREPISESSLLEAPEIGPVADTVALYEAMERMRTLPIGKRALIAIGAPAVLPLIAVVATSVPIRELLVKLMGALL